MNHRFHTAAFALASGLALGAGCGRGGVFDDGFSLGGPSGSTTRGSGGRSSSGPGGTGVPGASGTSAGLPSGTGTGSPGGTTSEDSTTNSNTGGQASSGTSAGLTTGSGASGRTSAGSGTGGSSGVSANTGGTGTTSGAGSGTGGQTTGGQDACNPGANPVEFVPCTHDSDCGCPMVCANDPFKGEVCESPCVQSGDCPDLTTFCNGTSCQVNLCGGDSGNGTFNSFCNVVGVNDGTCTPFLTADGTLVGICTQGGSADTCCDPKADRQDLDQACQAGMLCSGGGPGQGGVCGEACDPFGSASCPPGQTCDLMVDIPEAGACFPLTLPKC